MRSFVQARLETATWGLCVGFLQHLAATEDGAVALLRGGASGAVPSAGLAALRGAPEGGSVGAGSADGGSTFGSGPGPGLGLGGGGGGGGAATAGEGFLAAAQRVVGETLSGSAAPGDGGRAGGAKQGGAAGGALGRAAGLLQV